MPAITKMQLIPSFLIPKRSKSKKANKSSISSPKFPTNREFRQTYPNIASPHLLKAKKHNETRLPRPRNDYFENWEAHVTLHLQKTEKRYSTVPSLAPPITHMYTKNGKTYYSHQSLAHIDTEEKFKGYTREYHSSGEKRRSRGERDNLYPKQKLPNHIREEVEEQDFVAAMKKRRSARGRDVRASMYLKQKLPNNIREEEEDFVLAAKKNRVSRFMEKDLTEVKTVVLEAQDVTPGCELTRMKEEIVRVDGRPVEERCDIKRMSGGRPKLPRARRYIEEPSIVLGEVGMRGGEGGGVKPVGGKKGRCSMVAVREESEREGATAMQNTQNTRHSVQVPSKPKLATAGMSMSARSSFEVPKCAHVEYRVEEDAETTPRNSTGSSPRKSSSEMGRTRTSSISSIASSITSLFKLKRSSTLS